MKIAVLLLSLLSGINICANCKSVSNTKTDTIFFKDGTFILIADSAIVINDAAKKINKIWKTDTSRRHELGRALLHSWPKLIGIKAASLFDLLGAPDFYAPIGYKYDNTYAADGSYTGCWLSITFIKDRISTFWIGCPPE
jgi:hypothetical protein